MLSYTFKDGFREGVVFAFYQEGEILIETRPTVEGKKEVFFPSGSIEDKDYKETDYKVGAMYREVEEEFKGNIEILKHSYLGCLKVKEISVIFYIYLITEWKGEMPKYIEEIGENPSELKWINLECEDDYFKFDSAFEITSRIKKYLKE